MSRHFDKLKSPDLPSPLANSTKLSKSVTANDISLNRVSNEPTSTTAEKLSITSPDIGDTGMSPITHISSISKSMSNLNIGVCDKPKTFRKAAIIHKPVVGRKSISKKPSKNFKLNGDSDNKIGDPKVEKILEEIEMTKYQPCFQKIDMCKFRALKAIDLNALGITRQSEIKVFLDAIRREKDDFQFQIDQRSIFRKNY